MGHSGSTRLFTLDDGIVCPDWISFEALLEIRREETESDSTIEVVPNKLLQFEKEQIV